MNIHNWHNGRARHETDAFEVPENAESAGEEEEERGEKCRSYAVKRSSQQESPSLPPSLPPSSHLPDPLTPPSSSPPSVTLLQSIAPSTPLSHSPPIRRHNEAVKSNITVLSLFNAISKKPAAANFGAKNVLFSAKQN